MSIDGLIQAVYQKPLQLENNCFYYKPSGCIRPDNGTDGVQQSDDSNLIKDLNSKLRKLPSDP